MGLIGISQNYEYNSIPENRFNLIMRIYDLVFEHWSQMP